MRQHAVDAIGPRLLRRGTLLDRLRDDGIDTLVAGADDLEIDVAAFLGRLAGDAACRGPYPRRDTCQIVRRMVVDRQQHPRGPGARGGVVGVHLALHDRGELVHVVPGGVGQGHRRRKASRRTERGRERGQQAGQVLAAARDDRHHRRADPDRQALQIDLDAGRARLVHHVERDDDVRAGFEDLGDEVEVARERGGVRHDEHGVGPLADAAQHGVDRHLLVARSRAEAVGARQIDQVRRAEAGNLDDSRRARDGDAGVVADLDVRAGERVEERRLAGVWIARDEDDGSRGLGPGWRGRRGRSPARTHGHTCSSTSIESASVRRIDSA